MPVTRSSSSLSPSNIISPQRHQRNKQRSGATPVPNGDSTAVIVVSSDDEDRAPRSIQAGQKRTARQRAKAKAKSPGAVFLPIGDVVEVSSDDGHGDASTAPNNSSITVSKLQRQLKALQDETARLKQENLRLQSNVLQVSRDYKIAVDEVLQLKATNDPAGKGRIALDADSVEESISCEICALRLWTPYILPECGHSFCQSCLDDWFSTALTQHMVTHPHYNPNARLAPGVLEALHHLHRYPAHYQLQLQAQAAQHQQPHPKYTCPTCREEVRTRPVEDFALKALVRTVTEALGETSPRKDPVKRDARASAWDGFFPRAA